MLCVFVYFSWLVNSRDVTKICGWAIFQILAKENVIIHDKYENFEPQKLYDPFPLAYAPKV